MPETVVRAAAQKRAVSAKCLTALAALLSFAWSGCSSVKFYSQAIHGQLEILHKAKPVEQVTQDTGTPAEVKRKLAVVADVRRFAKERLGLPAERLYDRYTDLGRRHVSWVIFASPEFSVEGKKWRYPVVGELDYRGYFSEAAAKAEAARLEVRGFDVYVGGVDAYSTLGWFRDPVLNTFLYSSDAELAETLIHELAHVRLFLRGDTDFDEAFATTVGEAGARLWLQSRGDRKGLSDYEDALTKDREIIRLMLRTRTQLEQLYADSTLSTDAMRKRKGEIFAAMHRKFAEFRRKWNVPSHYDRNSEKPWNNARLNTAATYYEFVPAFQRMLEKHKGDFEAFYEEVGRMRKLTDEERRAALKASDAGVRSRPASQK